jgi:serine-type D-Ala-D-Ala carboxypeptidase/endopeptidase
MSLRCCLSLLALVAFAPLSSCSTRPAPSSAVTAERDTVERLDGSTISAEELTARIGELTQAADVPGLVVAVFNDAEPVYARAFGYAHRPAGRALSLDTEMYGASLSKAVFGVLVMNLVEEGVLDLDTPLVELVDGPLWVNHDPTGEVWHEDLSALADEPRADRITARMALAHTTGLPNWRWFEEDQKLRLHSDPGERYGYSGEGMVALQVALEKRTEQPLEDLAREHVFGLYGMETSSYRWQERFEGDFAHGHRSDGTAYPKDKDNDPRAPSTLETTPADLIRFLEGVLAGQGLRESSWDELFTPQVRIPFRTQFGPGATEVTDANDAVELSYGLGWGLLKTPHGWGAFKEGHGDGFQHYMIVFPEQRSGVLLLSNSDNAEGIFHQLLTVTLADTYTPLEWEGYEPPAGTG